MHLQQWIGNTGAICPHALLFPDANRKFYLCSAGLSYSAVYNFLRLWLEFCWQRSQLVKACSRRQNLQENAGTKSRHVMFNRMCTILHYNFN